MRVAHSYPRPFRCVWIAILTCCAYATTIALASAQTPVGDRPQLVIEDNDFRGPAGSDIQSVLPLLADRGVRVLGFTVVTGDGWENAESAALLRFLEVAGRTDVPVVDGAVYPLVNTVADWRERERQYGRIAWKGAWGEAGTLDNVPALEPAIPPMPQGQATTKSRSETAALFLIHAVHAHPNLVTIVAAGPLTNLALAIRLDPTFAATAKQLIFMGGLIDRDMAAVIGNGAFTEDFNIMFDPEAAHITLTADWPKITAVGDASGDVLFTHELMNRIAAKQTALTRFLGTYFAPLPMWDEITSAIAVDPSIVQTSLDAYMDVDLARGINYGRIHVWSDATAPKAMGIRKVTLVQTIDRQRFIEHFVAAAQMQPRR